MSKTNKPTLILMYSGDKTMFQSYYHKTQFTSNAIAQRHADKHNLKASTQTDYMLAALRSDKGKVTKVKAADMHNGRGKLVVIAHTDYVKKGYDKRTHMVRNAMTGEMVEENVNTPYSCSVASEAYWSN